MLSRVLRRVSLVVCLAAAAACGGVESEEVEQGGQTAAPAAEAEANDTSAMGPIGGCGYFRQRCCTYNVCYNGLECDPASGTCLY
jgi:hypothetical protein